MSVPSKRKTIESLCVTVTSGGTPSRAKANYWDNGTIPWFKTGELNDWYLDDAEERITEDALSASSAKLFPPETVLMAMYGDGRTITTLGLLRAEAATNQACCAMIVDAEKCHFLYLFYALKYHRHELLKLVVSGAQRNLSGGIIRSFKINCPPLATQNLIAAVLSPYDDLIDNNRRRIKLLEDSVRLLFDEWFVRLRFSGHTMSALVEGLPAGWLKLALDEVLLLQRGFDLPSQDRLAGDVPIYGSTGIVGFHNTAKVPGPGLVTGRSGSLGEVHFVAQDFWPLNTALWVKEFKRVTPLFALHLLRGMNLGQYNGGVSVPTLDRKVVHKAEVLLPSALIMERFESMAADVYRQIHTLTEMNHKLRTARDLLLPRLMSGELQA